MAGCLQVVLSFRSPVIHRATRVGADGTAELAAAGTDATAGCEPASADISAYAGDPAGMASARTLLATITTARLHRFTMIITPGIAIASSHPRRADDRFQATPTSDVTRGHEPRRLRWGSLAFAFAFFGGRDRGVALCGNA